MLSIPLILGVLLAAILIWFWQDSLGTRERANFAAQAACERSGLQFLDGTVAFARLALARNEHGQISLRRTYVFDYTAGDIERLQGFVMLLGQRVEAIGFAADDKAASAITPRAASHTGDDDAADNVLDLNEIRKRRGTTAVPGTKQSPNDWH